jgi:hypothetical protein
MLKMCVQHIHNNLQFIPYWRGIVSSCTEENGLWVLRSDPARVKGGSFKIQFANFAQPHMPDLVSPAYII